MPTWLGIDIGSASVKVALVRSTYRKMALARLASAEVAASGGAGEAAADRRRPSRSRASSEAPDAIAVAIEGSRAAIHRLLLPATAQKQLADVLAYELEAQIPFDLDERRLRLAPSRAARRTASSRSSPPWRASRTFAHGSTS